MITERVRLVVPDGQGLPVPSIALFWWYGTDVRIPFALVHADGQPYSLVGAKALLLGFKVNEADAAPFLQLEPDAYEDDEGGLGYFTIPRALAPTIGRRRVVFTIGFRDDDEGIEEVVLELSTANVKGRADSFDGSTTVLPTQVPLARGPAGPNFTPTPVKTAAYDASYGELVVCDSSDGEFAVRLPVPDEDHEGSRVGVVIAAETPNQVTVSPNDDETINGVAGSFSIQLPWQIVTFVIVNGAWIAS